MKQNGSLHKVWLTLFSVTSALFVVVGVAMMTVDHAYLNSSQYLLTALVFATATYEIAAHRIEPDYANPMFNAGFIFAIIGLTRPVGPSLHVGLWAFGIILFLYGLFGHASQGDKGYE